MTDEEPIAPDYRGGGIAQLVPAIAARSRGVPSWLPPRLADAAQVVVLVLDGLGWLQLQQRLDLAPTLASMVGGPITSVAPTTTATALTSISTGRPPSEHGIAGYRMLVEGEILNVLRWSLGGADARERLPPDAERCCLPFGGAPVPVITRQEFSRSGFTRVAFSTGTFVGWKAPSSIPLDVRAQLDAGAPLVYAYYDGVDQIAHLHGLEDHYDAELAAADALVSAVVAALPAGAALVVTSDHGQVHVGDRVVPLATEVAALASACSGEGRFMWLHGDQPSELAAVARDGHGHHAWVRTYDEVIAAGWLGGTPSPRVRRRLGDVALIARDPIAFAEPGEGPSTLVARHGSLTADEVLVPALVAWP